MSDDFPARLLAFAAALLPERRRQWGQAMQAELSGIPSYAERRRFAWDCARVAVRHSPVVGTSLVVVLDATLFVSTVTATQHLHPTLLHIALVAAVTLLVALTWLARRPNILGWTAANTPSWSLRAGGILLIAVLANGLALGMRGTGDAAAREAASVPVFTTMLTVCALAIVAVTSRGMPVPGRVLAIAGAGGLLGVLVWMVPLAVGGTIPGSPAWALLAMTGGGAAAGLLSSRRNGAEPMDSTVAGLVTGLVTGLGAALVGALAIVTVVSYLVHYGPDRVIPLLMPVQLAPADQLAQSRIETVDPYVGVLFVGSLVALALLVAARLLADRSTRELHGDVEVPGVAGVLLKDVEADPGQ